MDSGSHDEWHRNFMHSFLSIPRKKKYINLAPETCINPPQMTNLRNDPWDWRWIICYVIWGPLPGHHVATVLGHLDPAPADFSMWHELRKKREATNKDLQKSMFFWRFWWWHWIIIGYMYVYIYITVHYTCNLVFKQKLRITTSFKSIEIKFPKPVEAGRSIASRCHCSSSRQSAAALQPKSCF